MPERDEPPELALPSFREAITNLLFNWFGVLWR